MQVKNLARFEPWLKYWFNPVKPVPTYLINCLLGVKNQIKQAKTRAAICLQNLIYVYVFQLSKQFRLHETSRLILFFIMQISKIADIFLKKTQSKNVPFMNIRNSLVG